MGELTPLQLLNEHMVRMDAKLDQVLVDIAGLKVKSGIWGALGGLIPLLIGLIGFLVSR